MLLKVSILNKFMFNDLLFPIISKIQQNLKHVTISAPVQIWKRYSRIETIKNFMKTKGSKKIITKAIHSILKVATGLLFIFFF